MAVKQFEIKVSPVAPLLGASVGFALAKRKKAGLLGKVAASIGGAVAGWLGAEMYVFDKAQKQLKDVDNDVHGYI